MSLAPALRKSASWLLDAILPPRCLKCGEIVADSGSLCGRCWPELKFLGAAVLRLLRPAVRVRDGRGQPVRRVHADRPLYDRARAALTYDDASRDLILRFKHADRIDGAATFAGWMARAGAELVASADIIAPVPLHRWRLVRRRYNQAAILANAIGGLRGKLVIPDLLVRRRATPSPGPPRPQPAPPQRRRRLCPPSRPGPSG